jgi:hypothetical protein
MARYGDRHAWHGVVLVIANQGDREMVRLVPSKETYLSRKLLVGRRLRTLQIFHRAVVIN